LLRAIRNIERRGLLPPFIKKVIVLNKAKKKALKHSSKMRRGTGVLVPVCFSLLTPGRFVLSGACPNVGIQAKERK
jgi:hypothetical protein